MPNLRLHQVFAIILLLSGAIFATIGLMNPFYSIAVIQLLPNILWLIVPLMLLRPSQFHSVLGIFTSIYYYFKAPTGERRALGDNYINRNPYVDADKLHPIQTQLENMGLYPFGAFETYYGSDDGMNALVWVYADESRTLFAEICAYKNGLYGVEIRTEYTDGFLLGTLFNLPLDLDSERFHVRSFENLTEALDYHQYQASYQTATHGEPLRCPSFKAYMGTHEKDIAEKKAIAWDGGIAHLRAARWTILTMLICFIIGYSLTNLYHAAGIALVLTSIAFWIEDFTIPRKPVSQTMEQRKKLKALQQ